MFTKSLSGCVLFQFFVLKVNTLRVWFLQVTYILISKCTGEAYCMTESFLLLYWKQKCQANICFLFQCEYISYHIFMRRDALLFSSVNHWSLISNRFFFYQLILFRDDRIFLSWLIIDDFMLQNGKFSGCTYTENYAVTILVVRKFTHFFVYHLK
jgi:hypothetical protein